MSSRPCNTRSSHHPRIGLTRSQPSPPSKARALPQRREHLYVLRQTILGGRVLLGPPPRLPTPIPSCDEAEPSQLHQGLSLTTTAPYNLLVEKSRVQIDHHRLSPRFATHPARVGDLVVGSEVSTVPSAARPDRTRSRSHRSFLRSHGHTPPLILRYTFPPTAQNPISSREGWLM